MKKKIEKLIQPNESGPFEENDLDIAEYIVTKLGGEFFFDDNVLSGDIVLMLSSSKLIEKFVHPSISKLTSSKPIALKSFYFNQQSSPERSLFTLTDTSSFDKY